MAEKMFNGISNSFDSMLSSATDFGRGIKKSFKRHSKDVREFAQSVGEMVDIQDIIKSIQKTGQNDDRKSSNIIHHPINWCPAPGEEESSSAPQSPRSYGDEDEYLLFPAVSNDVLDKSPSPMNSASSQKENSNPNQVHIGSSTRRYLVFNSRNSQNIASSINDMSPIRENENIPNGRGVYGETHNGKPDINNNVSNDRYHYNGAHNENPRYVSQGPRNSNSIIYKNKEQFNTIDSIPENGKQRKTSVYRSPNFNCPPSTTSASLPYSPRPTTQPQLSSKQSRKISAPVFCNSANTTAVPHPKTTQNRTTVGSTTTNPKLSRSNTFSGASATRKKSQYNSVRHHSSGSAGSNPSKKNSTTQFQGSFKSFKESLASNSSSNQKESRKKSPPQIEDSINFLKESFKDPNSNNNQNKKASRSKKNSQQQAPDAITFLKESFSSYDPNANANQSKKYRKVSTNIPPTPKNTGRKPRKHSHPFFSSSSDNNQSKSSNPSIVYPPKMDFLRPSDPHGRNGAGGSRKGGESEKNSFKDYLKPPTFGYANDVNTRSPKRTRKVYTNKHGK